MQREFRRIIAILWPLGQFALLLVVTLSTSRALLIGWQLARVLDAGMLATVLVQGLRFDLILVGFFLLWVVLPLPILCTSDRMMRFWRPLLLGYLTACFAGAIFLEVSTPPFLEQFDARPNRLFIEYLVYPKEIIDTLLAAYVPVLIAAWAILAAALVLAWRLLKPRIQAAVPIRVTTALLMTPLLAMLCAGLIRSTLDHRAVNPSTVALSPDPMVNDLAMNSLYTLLYAVYEEQSEPDGGFRYSDMPKDQVVAQVRAAMEVDPGAFVDDALPTLHSQTASRRFDKPKNLVIILEESLGAEFVGALGGLPLTPRLDALAAEGLWFKNLYATGTRSVRGIEALVTGFTPTPARSVVKLGRSQRGFFTLGELLRARGYETSFIYGGEAQFDNMGRFFTNNGFSKVIDKDNYDDPVFLGSWGVSDEDLFRYAHEEFSKPREAPFFAFVFSTSNHTPYEFPDGRIELYEDNKNTVNNAVKYADYAVGQFIDMAKASNYWEDTIFLIVSDHNSRVYGPQLVPIDHFHIPGLVLGADIAPQVYEPIASQIDLAPTLLSLIGVSATHPMIGHDLTRPQFADVVGRAILQFNGTQAYMQGDQVVVLRKDLAPEEFTYDGLNLLPNTDHHPALVELGLAHANWSSIAYEEELYRLPKSAPVRLGRLSPD